jgi:putative heme-binding domain-containing protein
MRVRSTSDMQTTNIRHCEWAAIAAAAFAVAIGHLAAAQHAGSYTPADVENGARLFGQHCSTCHGADGDMVPTANLRKGEFRRGSSDEDLMRTISKGVPGTAMNGHNFNPSDLAALVAYLRSMRDFGSRPVAVGDGSTGRVLFEGKACLSCHRVNGQGSRLAADLSDVGAIRSSEALERALLDPTGIVPAGRRFVRAVTADGRVVQGRRLNEDTFTVQLIDDQGRLRSLTKSELREYTVSRTSPELPAKHALTAEDRAHVIAYLSQLKGETGNRR